MGNLKSKVKKNKQGKGNINLPDSTSGKKTVDPRLPFENYRQIFSIKNAWKAIMRTLEETSREHLIKFLSRYPHYKDAFPSLNRVHTEDQMRESMEFEIEAANVFQVFDDVITNLENVDKALDEIHRVASSGKGVSTPFVKDMKDTFMETIKNNLGERLTEASENNFLLLYDFIVSEMEKAC